MGWRLAVVAGLGAALLVGCGSSDSSTAGGSGGAAGSGAAASGASATALSFSGAVQGATANPRPELQGAFCGQSTSPDTPARWELIAALDGADYDVDVEVTGYKAPGTFTVGPDGPAAVYFGKTTPVAGGGVQLNHDFSGLRGTVTITSRTGGTVDADYTTGDSPMSSSTASGHVAGSFSCLGPGTRP